MSKNKNKLYNNFSFIVNRYAPESFKLYYNNQPVKLSDQTRQTMGYAAITQGKQAVLKLIKQWQREQYKQAHNPVLAIVSADKKEFYYIRKTVNRYDIHDKLFCFKAIKEAFNAERFSMKTQSAKLDANYKPYDVKDEINNKTLGNRIIFI